MKIHALLLLSLLIFTTSLFAQKKYKQMMNDNNVNFYDVVKEANKYFDKIDKAKKGSGWKPFQRWVNANEYKYAPSGRRDNINPFFAENAYKAFLKNNNILPQQKNSFTGWNELGPAIIDNITGHYSAGLGRIEDFYVDPITPSLIYLGSRSGGFWKSTNGGQNWTGGTTDFLFASGVNTMAVDPTNNQNIVINVQNSDNNVSHGLYQSTNGGDTWFPTNFIPTNTNFGGLGSDFKVYKIVYHPTIPDLIFIGSNKGIFKSTDNLVTWTRIINTFQYGYTDIANITDIEFHPTDSNIIYITDSYYWCDKNKIYRSTNTGVSYTTSNNISIANGNPNTKSLYLSVSPDCADCVYVATNIGVWKSTNKGIDFTFKSEPESPFNSFPSNCDGFAVSDTDHTKMIYGYVDIASSADDGNAFTYRTRWSLGNTNGAGAGNQNSFNISTDYIHADLRVVKSVNGVFYVGTDGLFCKSSDNGVHWEILSDGLAIRENYKLGVSQSNSSKSISGSQDNGTSIKIENGWIEFYGADGMEGIIHPLNDDWMIGSSQFGGRVRTKDGGQSQDHITPNGAGNADWEAPIFYDPNNQMTIYDFRTSIAKSDNFGSNWTIIGSPSFSGEIDEFAIAENNSNILIASNSEKIEKSIDAGVSWTNIQGTLPDNTIKSIAFDPNNDDTIIVTYATYQNNNNKIFITTDGGVNWANITHNLGNMPIHSVVIDHTPAKNIYLGAEIGVYTKPMSSNIWSLYNVDLPNTTIQELEIVYASNTLKAATWGRGLWEYSLVGRNNFPSIETTRITDQPTDDFPRFGFDQFITSTIVYSGTLTNVEVRWSANNLNFDNNIAMSNTTGNTWVSDTAITNLPEGTKIYFKVFATGNNNDTTETYKFMYTVKPFEYCIAGGDGSINPIITNVSIAGLLNNNSGQTQYHYYDAATTELVEGQTYQITINSSTSWSDNDYAAWIDYNNDKIFDASEQILVSINPSTSSASASFTVPNNAKIDELLRMRVRLSYWGSNPTPCGETLGEVEDYEINIIENNLSTAPNLTSLLDKLVYYPNPTNGKLTIDLGNVYSSIDIKVIDLLGQTIQKNTFENQRLINLAKF